MPVSISFDDVIHTHRVGDGPDATEFDFREINAGHIEDCTTEASKTNKYEPSVYLRELWARILVGWRRLYGPKPKGEGEPKPEIPFTVPADRTTKDAASGEVRPMTQAEWVYAVSRALPPHVRQQISSKAHVGHADEETALGN